VATWSTVTVVCDTLAAKLQEIEDAGGVIRYVVPCDEQEGFVVAWTTA